MTRVTRHTVATLPHDAPHAEAVAVARDLAARGGLTEGLLRILVRAAQDPAGRLRALQAAGLMPKV